MSLFFFASWTASANSESLFGYELGSELKKYFTEQERRDNSFDFEEAAAKKYYDMDISEIMPGKHKSPHFSHYYLIYDNAGIIHSIDATQVYKNKERCSERSSIFVDDLEKKFKLPLNKKTWKIFPDRDSYLGFEAKDFSNKFSVGVDCIFYFEYSEAEMLMYVSSQQLKKDIKEFYANDYKTQSLSEESHDYLFLLFLVPVIFILVIIASTLSSMKSDMRQ